MVENFVESGFREGGCLCGSVRYRITQPLLAVVACHCKNCQKQAGSALSIIAVAARPALEIQGELATYEDRGSSGQTVLRRFCPRCGSPIISDMASAEAQGMIFVKAGTLDDSRDLQPSAHFWTASAQAWFPFADGMVCLERE